MTSPSGVARLHNGMTVTLAQARVLEVQIAFQRARGPHPDPALAPHPRQRLALHGDELVAQGPVGAGGLPALLPVVLVVA